MTFHNHIESQSHILEPCLRVILKSNGFAVHLHLGAVLQLQTALLIRFLFLLCFPLGLTKSKEQDEQDLR